MIFGSIPSLQVSTIFRSILLNVNKINLLTIELTAGTLSLVIPKNEEVFTPGMGTGGPFL
jgi:hypothetical protein